jgi:hypothetical protein
MLKHFLSCDEDEMESDGFLNIFYVGVLNRENIK